MFAGCTADHVEHLAEERAQAGEFLFEARANRRGHFSVAAQLAAGGFLEQREVLDEQRFDRARRRSRRNVEANLSPDAVQLSGHAVEESAKPLLLAGAEPVLDAREHAGRGIDPSVDFGAHVLETTQESRENAAVAFAQLEFWGLGHGNILCTRVAVVNWELCSLVGTNARAGVPAPLRLD